MMPPEDQLEEVLADVTSLYQRAKKGERGRTIARDVEDVRRRLEDVVSALEA